MPPKPLRRMRDRHFIPYVISRHWLKAFCVAPQGGHACGITFDLFPPPNGYKPKNPKKKTYYLNETAMLNDWHKLVLEKDGKKCKLCNSKDSLESHHIYPKAGFPHLRFVLDIGVTLCSDCHNAIHMKRSELLKTTLTPYGFRILTKNVSMINKNIEDPEFWENYTGVYDRAELYLYNLQNEIPMFEGRSIEEEKEVYEFMKEQRSDFHQ